MSQPIPIYDDLFYMAKALELARLAAQQGEVPVGAVIVDAHHKVVSEAFNLRETQQSATAHAELLAIDQACKALGRWRLYGCTLYVTLEPCFMCAGGIVLARLPRVVFAARDPKAGAVGSLANVLEDGRLNHRCVVEGGVREEEASQLLKEFFKARRQ